MSNPDHTIQCICKKVEQKPGDFKRCSACKQVKYCSTECQKKHWPQHKEMCQKYCQIIDFDTFLKKVNSDDKTNQQKFVDLSIDLYKRQGSPTLQQAVMIEINEERVEIKMRCLAEEDLSSNLNEKLKTVIESSKDKLLILIFDKKSSHIISFQTDKITEFAPPVIPDTPVTPVTPSDDNSNDNDNGNDNTAPSPEEIDSKLNDLSVEGVPELTDE